MHHLPNIPLERLFQRLELAGFVISPADRLRVYRLLDGPAKQYLHEPERLRELLAPVLARSAAEQAKFYELFDQYLTELRQPLDLKPTRRVWDVPPWLRYLFLAGLLALVGYMTYVFLNRPEPKSKLAVYIDGPPYASAGDTVTFFNRSRYSGDSSELRWRWEYYDVASQTTEQVDTQHFDWEMIVPPNAGKNWQKEIRLSVYHPEEDSLYTVQAPFAIFCPSPPAVDRLNGTKQTEVGENARFTIIADPAVLQITQLQGRERITGPAANWTYIWDFGDDTVDSTGTYFATHTFEENGIYIVKVSVRDTTGNGICETTHSLEVRVGAEKAFLPLATLNRDRLEPLASWGWGFYLLLGLIGLAVIYYWVRYFARQRQEDQDDAEAPVSPQEKELRARFQLGDRAPYFIPLRDQNKQIAVDAQQLRLADALRLRQLGVHKRIDVPATLQATIDKGGYPELRYRYATRPSEYLFLIDEQSRAGHLGRLFKHLVSLLREQDVYAETYYYRQHFTRFWNNYHPEGLSLEQLHNSYSDYRLVVLGDLHELIDPTAAGQPQLRTMAANVIRSWSQRLLLTPVPPVSWSYREKLLARLFNLFPADVDGLGAAALHLENEGELLADGTAFEAWKVQQIALREDTDTEHRNWRRWRGIKEYLQAYDEELVHWFQALAVFPLPAWEMTIAIGRGLGITVTYDKLLQLARIPALQKDTFDERLRQELLRELDPEVENFARRAVKAELAAVQAVAKGAHVQRELETALAIQNFALDPEAPENQDAVRFLLRHNIISKGQEAELDKVTTRHEGAELRKKQMMTKGGARRLPEVKVREYLATREETDKNTPPPPEKEEVSNDLLKAIAATAAYLILLLIGWQLGGSEALYRLAFGEKPEERRIQRADQPLRDYFLVKEDVIVDSAVIYNNQAVDHYEAGRINEAESALQRANRARGLYIGKDGTLSSDYLLGSANFSRIQYNRAASLLESYLQDSIDQAAFAERYQVVQVKLVSADSDSLAADILHARGVTSYYLGRPDSLLEDYYLQLDSLGYFERIDYSPNLATLLRRERSRIRDLNIQPADNQALDINIDYYYNAERDGKNLEVVAYSEGDDTQPEAVRTRAEQGPGSTTLSLRPDRRTNGRTTHIVVELRRGEEVVNSVRTAYRHSWREPERPPNRRDTEATPNESNTTLSQEQLRMVPIELRGSVFPDGPEQRGGIAGIDVSLLPASSVRLSRTQQTALNAAIPTARTDRSGDYILRVSLPPTGEDAYTLTATDPEGRYATYEQSFTAAQLRNMGPKELVNINMRPAEVEVRYIEPEMVRVGGGTFTMGCVPRRDGECNENELPAHEVTVSTFEIGKYEVTNAEFVLFLQAEGNQEEGGEKWVDYKSSFIQEAEGEFTIQVGYEESSVIGVSWYAAQAYTDWLGRQTGRKYRLPTEAEWEYAARGGKDGPNYNFTYSGSNEIEEVAWYSGNSKGRTHSVGQLKPNQLGIYDMSGNAYEWCSNWEYNFEVGAKINPRGTEFGDYKAIRGGGWVGIPATIRCATRNFHGPNDRRVYTGFRVVRFGG